MERNDVECAYADSDGSEREIGAVAFTSQTPLLLLLHSCPTLPRSSIPTQKKNEHYIKREQSVQPMLDAEIDDRTDLSESRESPRTTF